MSRAKSTLAAAAGGSLMASPPDSPKPGDPAMQRPTIEAIQQPGRRRGRFTEESPNRVDHQFEEGGVSAEELGGIGHVFSGQTRLRGNQRVRLPDRLVQFPILEILQFAGRLLMYSTDHGSDFGEIWVL